MKNPYAWHVKVNMSVLREITSEIHRQAESTPFVQYMYSGNISKRDYSTYLKQIVKIYTNLEYYCKVSGLTLGLVDLDRAEYIREDIEELGSFPDEEMLPSVKNYINHLTKLYHSSDRHLLMAHIYVRHMGDLFGGKMIAKRVPGSGKYYQFEDRPTLVKQLGEKVTMELAEEALYAFQLSIEVFNEMYELMEDKNGKEQI